MKHRKFFSLASLLLFALAAPGQTAKKTILCGSFLNGRADTLHLSFFKQRLGIDMAGAEYIDAVAENGKFCFTLPQFSRLAYISLESSKWPRLYLDSYIVEPGDSIFCSVDQGNIPVFKNINKSGLLFSGNGADKFTARYTVDSMEAAFEKSLPMFILKRPVNLDSMFLGFRLHNLHLRDYTLSVLEKFRVNLSPLAYGIMRADLYYRKMILMQQGHAIEWPQAFRYADSTERISKLANYSNEFFIEKKLPAGTEALNFSKEYLDFMIRNCLIFSRNAAGVPAVGDVTRLYPEIQKVNPAFRERLITGLAVYLPSRLRTIRGAEQFMQYALDSVYDNGLHQILEDCYVMSLKGKKFFPFQLTGLDNKIVTPLQFAGKLVLVDYWFTGCTPCKLVAEKLKGLHERVPGINLEILSVSVDNNRANWMHSVESEQYSSKKDINVSTGRWAFQHPLLRHYQVASFPRLMIIDPNGNLFTANATRPADEQGLQKLVKELVEASGQ